MTKEQANTIETHVREFIEHWEKESENAQGLSQSTHHKGMADGASEILAYLQDFFTDSFMEEEGERKMNTIAKFEKVSFEEWMRSLDCENPSETLKEVWGSYWDEIELPKRSTTGSCGYDFTLPYDLDIFEGEFDDYPIQPTGIRCKIEEGYFLQLVPKSGIGTKYGFRFRNTVGIIDSDYYNSDNEGHIKFSVEVEKDLQLGTGDKIFQGIFLPYYLAEEEPPKAIRNGGHGSTGA